MAKAKHELTNRQVQGPADEMLTLEQLAAWLGVTKTFIYRRTCKGHTDPIPSYRFGGHLRFRRQEIEAWIEAHRNEASDAVAEAVQTIYLDRPRKRRGPTPNKTSQPPGILEP